MSKVTVELRISTEISCLHKIQVKKSSCSVQTEKVKDHQKKELNAISKICLCRTDSIRAKNWRWPFWPPLFRRPCIVHSSTSQRAVEYISTQYISLSCLVQKTKELYRNLSYQVDHDFTFFASSSPSLFSQRGHILHPRMYVPVGWKYYARCGKTQGELLF